ncbi:MAG: hypothetical protein ACHBNF_18500 [Chromatiales bacterium]
MKGPSPVLQVPMGTVEDRVAVPNFQRCKRLRHLDARQEFAAPDIEDGDRVLGTPLSERPQPRPALADFVLVKPFCAAWFAVQARETRHRIFGQPSATQRTVALLVFWLVVAGLAARLESRNRRAV